jgi:hypothetical protein
MLKPQTSRITLLHLSIFKSIYLFVHVIYLTTSSETQTCVFLIKASGFSFLTCLFYFAVHRLSTKCSAAIVLGGSNNADSNTCLQRASFCHRKITTLNFHAYSIISRWTYIVFCDTSQAWRFLSSGMWRRVIWYIFTDVSEERAIFSFRTKQYRLEENRTFLRIVGIYQTTRRHSILLRNVRKYLSDYMASHPGG